ncbi:hypothetical protein [Actinomyces lilanjuaniae]|uniref:hypothetical protein n=1 Tax=Actinomyces lilanjuaniae TaxID=2321394 RepID=UPI001968EDD1|nr:hypothetical protein [Actinomyces lilanjuaniae]
MIHFPDNGMISIDAQPWVAAEVAAWVRSLHPDPSLVLWYTDEGFTGHTVLTPGITPTQIDHQWVDHRDHDPEQEYPTTSTRHPHAPWQARRPGPATWTSPRPLARAG